MKKHIYFNSLSDDASIMLSNKGERVSNIFLDSSIKSSPVILLEPLFHELGHALDYRETSFSLDYDYQSFYKEVEAHYQQQKFLEFVINESKIYKSIAEKRLFDYFDYSLQYLEEDRTMRKAWDGLCFYNNTQYTYGALLANSLLRNPSVRDSFLDMKSSSLSYDSLSEIGLSEKVICDSLQETVKTYFK